MTSWTPDRVKDPEAVKRRDNCIGWGIALWVGAFFTSGAPGAETVTGWMVIGGGALFFIASKINIWRDKKGEAGFY